MQKKFIHLLSTLFPGLVVKMAYKTLTSPQVRKLRENEIVVLDQAEKETLPFKGFQIKLYRWQGGPRKVMLVHGWEGHAGNFSDLVGRLLAQGYTVLAFDAPSHGFSSSGQTSLFEFAELVGHLIRKWEVRNLVSHSFGGVATTYALFNDQEWKIDKYALLTTPDKFQERIDDVSEEVGVSQKVIDRIVARMQRETSLPLETLNVSNFVQHINVKDALIIHDKNDKVLPITRSRNVANHWPVCEFVEIEGTGHFRILRTQAVLDRVVDFLRKGTEPSI